MGGTAVAVGGARTTASGGVAGSILAGGSAGIGATAGLGGTSGFVGNGGTAGGTSTTMVAPAVTSGETVAQYATALNTALTAAGMLLLGLRQADRIRRPHHEKHRRLRPRGGAARASGPG